MKVTKLMPFMAIIALLGFTSCSNESAEEDSINSIELLIAPDAKQIEIESSIASPVV